jgi:hypothetical protein
MTNCWSYEMICCGMRWERAETKNGKICAEIYILISLFQLIYWFMSLLISQVTKPVPSCTNDASYGSLNVYSCFTAGYIHLFLHFQINDLTLSTDHKAIMNVQISWGGVDESQKSGSGLHVSI